MAVLPFVHASWPSLDPGARLAIVEEWDVAACLDLAVARTRDRDGEPVDVTDVYVVALGGVGFDERVTGSDGLANLDVATPASGHVVCLQCC